MALAIESSGYMFLTSFGSFSTDRQTARQTNQPRRVGLETPIPELKAKPEPLQHHTLVTYVQIICSKEIGC